MCSNPFDDPQALLLTAQQETHSWSAVRVTTHFCD